MLGNLCGAQREFRFQPKERSFLLYEGIKKIGNMKVFDGSSNFGSGSFFQAPSLSGPMTCQEQGSPDSPQVFSISAPKASGHDEFQQALKDPEFAKAVRGLELCLRVRERERLRDSGMDTCRVSHDGRQGLCSKSAGGGVDSASVLGESGVPVTSSSVEGVSAPCPVRRAPVVGIEDDLVFKQNAGVVAGIEDDSVFKQNTGVASSSLRRAPVGGALRRSGPSAHASASESDRVIGLLEVTESEFPSLSYSVNSCLGLSTSACARASRFAGACAGAAARVCSVSSSSAVSAVAHAHASPLHGAHNSWSDTVRVQGPKGRRCTKGGVSSPAEDLRPVSEVETGVNFRPAGWVRGQVAGSLPGRQPGTGTRQSKGSVVTPSLHPEVPDSLSVLPGPGKRIRQSMGWTKVCGTAQSGIWVLKGNARACMFPANLDHLRVGWRKQGSHKTAWVTPGHDCLCACTYGHGAAVRPQTNKAIWDGSY